MTISQKEALFQQYPYKIELHAHTSPASSCSEVSPEDVVRLYKEHGYDAIVITNHYLYNGEDTANKHLSDYRHACEAGEKYGVNVLLGAEIKLTENKNEYLIYGVDAEILKNVEQHLDGTLEEFRRNFPLPDSLLIQAHPFRSYCTVAEDDLLDGIEVFNLHPHHNSNNHLALAHGYENPNLIRTAGSDFHHDKYGHCGTAATRTKTLPKDSFELAAILRSGDYLLQLHDAIYVP